MMGEKVVRFRSYGLVGVMVALVWAGASGNAVASMPRGANPTSAVFSQPHRIQLAGLFGDDEEEQAAQQRAQQREQAQDASIANLSQRVSELEHSLRQLTGQLEEANHRNAVLQERMVRMQKDFDYKLCTLAAQQLAAGTDGGSQDTNALPCDSLASSGVPPSPAVSQQGSAAAPAPVQRGGAPGVLGTLPAGTPLPQPNQVASTNTPAAGAGTPPSGSSSSSSGPAARAQFDSAMNLLAKAQYDDARSAFRSFADANPKDDLTPQAVYWIGAIAYVQKDYAGAARAFAEEIKEYPNSPRAPESMLKLGQSLIAMNQKQEGCTTLGAISGKYPKASKTIHQQAAQARRAARCR